MKTIKLILLKFIKPQTRIEGDHTIHFKTLFGKIHIIEKKLESKELFLNGRLLKMYMEKL